MLSKNIKFKNFNFKLSNKKIKKDLSNLLSEGNEILKSLTPVYKYKYSKQLIKKNIKEKVLRIIGMGGSVLGTQAIHDFMKHKVQEVEDSL